VKEYREICGINLGGSDLKRYELIKKCEKREERREDEVVKMMKSALEEDENERDEEKYVGLEE
jgi:hypothetical protein